MPTKTALDSVEQGWTARLERARELAHRHLEAAAVLRFYELVLGFQRDVARASAPERASEAPLREQIDVELALAKLPALLALTLESGPPKLSDRAKTLRRASSAGLRDLLESGIASASSDAVTSFFARASLQPLAERIQARLPADPNYAGNVCPACGARPQAAVLRPEGEGAQRWLLCSFCLREWLFRRLICPCCGEEDKDKLPHYSAEGCASVRIEACETCKRYLKAVDLTADGHAVPLIDEAAAPVLDVWAGEHGYSKIVLNLMGL